MTVPEALITGDLRAALTIVETQLHDAPNDAALLLLHVELLAIAGRILDAWRELQMIESPDAEWPVARRRFRQILRAAHDRSRGKRPEFLFDAPHHARRRWQAIRRSPGCIPFDAAVEERRLDDVEIEHRCR